MKNATMNKLENQYPSLTISFSFFEHLLQQLFYF